jgi:hypothetical protein
MPKWMFDLARFDEPAPEPPADPPVADPPPDPAPEPPVESDKDKTDYKADAEKWKALSRKHEANAKSNADAAKKLADIEDAQKSETERLAAAKEAAEQRATAAITRAVRAEVKAMASGEFADPSDAEDAINPADYVDDSGEINTDAIKARLAELLEAKPHWRKAASPATPPPRPDPGQGSRPTPPATNFRDAPHEEFAAELAKHGVKPRST